MRHHPTADLGMARTRVMGGFQLKEFSQPPHRRLPWHEHRDASICFVVAGSYAERMRGQDRECAPHAMIFKPPGERHADQFGREGGTCLLIEIGPERLETLAPVSDVTARPGVARSARLAGLGHRIYREFAAGDARLLHRAPAGPGADHDRRELVEREGGEAEEHHRGDASL